MEYLTMKLLRLLGVLTALKIQFVVFHNLFNQLALQLQKAKLLLVKFIILAQSIKVALINAVQSLGVIGSQLATIVRKIPQLVKDLLKKGK
jgi:hypothetical protein